MKLHNHIKDTRSIYSRPIFDHIIQLLKSYRAYIYMTFSEMSIYIGSTYTYAIKINLLTLRSGR
jgi:hypothetical protein